jgi:hypothetical protein
VDRTACTRAPLAQTQGCRIDVRFAPRAVGARAATLVIADNAGTGVQTVSLRGNG